MVALFIVVIASTWFLLVESQLVVEHQHSIEKLQAARLAKELADNYQVHGRDRASINRAGLNASMQGENISVYKGQRLLLEVKGSTTRH